MEAIQMNILRLLGKVTVLEGNTFQLEIPTELEKIDDFYYEIKTLVKNLF